MPKVPNRSIDAFCNRENKIEGFLLLHNSRRKRKLWIIVEGDDDKQLFDLLLPSRDIYISTSAMKIGETGNCENVMYLVYHLRSLVKEMPTIGIRDKDYLPFTKEYRKVKDNPNLLYTDTRDMENMVFSSNTVTDTLEALYVGFNQKLADVYKVTRPMGILQIYNMIRKIGATTGDSMRPSKLFKKGSLGWNEDEETTLIGAFNSSLPRNRKCYRLNSRKYRKIIRDYHRYADNMLCRGHDIVACLNYSNAFPLGYSIKEQYSDAFELYAQSGDFIQTQLYKQIEAVARKYTIERVRGTGFPMTHNQTII